MRPSPFGKLLLGIAKSAVLVVAVLSCGLAGFSQNPTPEFLQLMKLANQRYQAGDLDGAIANYQQAVKLDPNSGAAYSSLGSALLDKGDFKGSAAAFEAAVALAEKPRAARPGSTVAARPDPLPLALALNNLALAYYQAHRYDDAR